MGRHHDHAHQRTHPHRQRPPPTRCRACCAWPTGSAGRHDPVTRQRLVDAYLRHQLIRFLGWRVQSAISRGQAPGPESSVLKLAHTAALTRLADLGARARGSDGHPDARTTTPRPTRGRSPSSASSPARSAAAPTRCSATSSPNGCSACPATSASTRMFHSARCPNSSQVLSGPKTSTS